MARFARKLGCGYIASETGTYNAESDWVCEVCVGHQPSAGDIGGGYGYF